VPFLNYTKTYVIMRTAECICVTHYVHEDAHIACFNVGITVADGAINIKDGRRAGAFLNRESTWLPAII
jgi:hypothetical protein